MSNLSDLLPAGAGGKTADFTANGAIASGKPVILESGGDVAQVTETTVSPSMPLGSVTQFEGGASQYYSVKADPHNDDRWIITWMDDVGTKKYLIKIITRSGTSFTQSPEIDAGLSGTNSSEPGVAWDKGTADKILIVYNNSSNDGTAKVGTISGSAGSESISFGSELTFTTKQMLSAHRSPLTVLCMDTSGNYFVSFTDGASSSNAYGRILQVSGTTVTAGGSDTSIATSVWDRAQRGAMHPTDTTKIIYGYFTTSTENIRELTVSGTTITAGTSYSGGTIADGSIQVLPISATKVVMGARNSSSYPIYTIVTNSSGAFTWGTQNVATSTAAYAVDSDNNLDGDSLTFISVYARNTTPRYPYGITCTLNSGVSSITFATPIQLDSNENAQYYLQVGQQSDNDGHFVAVYEPSTFDEGLFVLGKTGGSSTNLTATNFVGIADAAISDNASGSIVLQGGVSEKLSSLTTGSTYYVQSDGTFATTAGSPSVEAGKALSATKLLIKGP
jgi:hypothetical protein|tara:strand:- start:468 stop:1982 length:1515 start_codon:yes stop_codon:yes gene_type:complete